VFEDVVGRNCLTRLCGMDITSDKLRSLVKKWQTTIEANIDVKTIDGFVLRLFIIGFTMRRPNQIKKTSYAQSSQIRHIRKRMVDIGVKEATSCDFKSLIHKLIPEVIGKQIEKSCSGIYPLHDCMVRKIKVLKVPKIDLSKLIDTHDNVGMEIGTEIERPADVIMCVNQLGQIYFWNLENFNLADHAIM
jgi:small subunit ribosomal protein S3Ae